MTREIQPLGSSELGDVISTVEEVRLLTRWQRSFLHHLICAPFWVESYPSLYSAPRWNYSAILQFRR